MKALVGLGVMMCLGLAPAMLGKPALAEAAAGNGTPAAGATTTLGNGAHVESLLGEMTLDEKISLLAGQPDGFSVGPISRLGIPKLVMADGPQGVRNYGSACAFPCGAALAATWDGELAKQYGDAMGLEARARGVHFQLGPAMNICRIPVDSRNFEYFSEDPCLCGSIATHWVTGIQSEGVVATIKHFAANNQETDRESVDVEADPRTLQEIYFPAFKQAVQQGGALALMSAYNRLNGSYCSENNWLLNQTLKQEWHYDGLVMSDWNASHATDDLAKGLDLEMGTAKFFKPPLIKAALANGTLTVGEIDGAVRRLLRVAETMHFLEPDHQQKRSDLPLDSKRSAEVALHVAEGAVVMLKNQNDLLPLDRMRVHRIAVYGPNAAHTPPTGSGSGVVTPFRPTGFVDGIKATAGATVEVINVPMPRPTGAFDSLGCCRTSAGGDGGDRGGAPGLKFFAPERSPDAAPVTQTSINLTWDSTTGPIRGQRHGAQHLRWTGVLLDPQGGDWQIFRDADVPVDVYVADKLNRFASGEAIHVPANVPVPIRIEAEQRRDENRQHHVRMGLARFVPNLAAARSADVVIACVGFNGNTETEAMDRSWSLSADQNTLIDQLTQANPHTIVVINSGGGIDMPWADETAAIVQAWYLGQEGPTALARVLFGEVNPSGKLPVTIDRTLADNLSMANYPGERVAGKDYPLEPYREGIYVGYRGYDKSGKQPRFPFGFGLSYTTFRCDQLVASSPASDGSVSVSADVTNTGKRAGADVVEVYVAPPAGGRIDRPLRELKGFSKITAAPGETRHVAITLPPDAFAYWSSARNDWTVDPGDYAIEIGESERQIVATTHIQIK